MIDGVKQHNLNFNLLMLLTLIIGYHIASFIISFIRIRRIFIISETNF
jgi:hypothetical protein